MSFALVPLRRVGIQHVAFGVVGGACGVVESWGSSLALAALVTCIPFGIWVDRYRVRTFAYPVDVLAPRIGVVEPPARTAVRTLNAMFPLVVALVIGAFLPLVGSMGGGAIGGIAISDVFFLRRLKVAETHHDSRVIVRVPASLILRKKWTPVYYEERP